VSSVIPKPAPLSFEEASGMMLTGVTAAHARAVVGSARARPIRTAARLSLARLAEAGKLRVIVAATYPLAETAAAHRALATGHTRGKIVLVP
jgi:NADPH:quinone reductase-like Zn-dependent oxidoreductase